MSSRRLALAAAVAALLVVFKFLPGTLLVHWQGYEVRCSLFFSVLLLAVLWGLNHLLRGSLAALRFMTRASRPGLDGWR